MTVYLDNAATTRPCDAAIRAFEDSVLKEVDLKWTRNSYWASFKNADMEDIDLKGSAIDDKAAESKDIQELNLKVKQAIADKEAGYKHEAGGVFVIMGRTLGRGDDKLGGILIKGFLAGLARAEPVPDSIILLNGGVKLALFDSSTCDHLKDLEARGTQILISGVCTSHFGITDSIGAGVIANIYEIVDVINKAVKVVCL